MYYLCNIYVPFVHHLCNICVPFVHHLCTICVPFLSFVYHIFTIYLPFVYYLCTICAPFVQQETFRLFGQNERYVYCSQSAAAPSDTADPHKHNEVCSYVSCVTHLYFVVEVQRCCIRDSLYLLRDEPTTCDVRSEIFQTGISACHVECAADGIAVWHWKGTIVACKHKKIPSECLNKHSKIMTRIVLTALCRK